MSDDQIDPTSQRRTFLRRAAVAGGVVWASPMVLTVAAGAQTSVWNLQLDDTGNPVDTTASVCSPDGWVDGEPALVNGENISWILVPNNDIDATQGFELTVTDPGAVILGAQAVEVCACSSPPGSTRCVSGTIGPDNVVSFPDNFNPECCVYEEFRIRIQSGS